MGKLKSNDQLQGHSDTVSDHDDNDVCHSDDNDDGDVGDDNDVDVDDDDNDDEAVGLGSGALLNIGARPKTSPRNLPRPLSTPLTFDFTHEQCRRTKRYIHISPLLRLQCNVIPQKRQKGKKIKRRKDAEQEGMLKG